MLKIDDNLLQQIGLGALPVEEKRNLLNHIYETLEMRVGMRLADQMSNEQLDEFEQYFEAKDDAGAFKWLESNFPNYKDIVNEEFEKLRGEVSQNAPHILAAAQQQIAAAQAAGAQPGMPVEQVSAPQQPFAQAPAVQQQPDMFAQQQQAPQPPVYAQPEPPVAAPQPVQDWQQPQPDYNTPRQAVPQSPQPQAWQPVPMQDQVTPSSTDQPQPPAGFPPQPPQYS